MHPTINTALEVAERILTLIRPRFYNRLTWVVVAAGLLLIATPWWGDLVGALARKYLGVVVPVSSEHATLGVGLVAIGLVYHILAHSIYELVVSRREGAQQSAYRDHDRQVFLGLQAISAERQLLGVLEDIATVHHYYSSDGSQISGAVQYLRAPSTQFIDGDVSTAAADLAIKLATLRNFMSQYFVEHMSPQDGDMRFCLFPDGNVDRSSGMPSLEQSTRYDQLSEELDKHLRNAEEGYAKFRSIVKLRLAV